MAEEMASQGATPAASQRTAEAAPPAREVPPAEIETEIKIKVRKPRQRACDEMNAKGKLCAGHLKRWYDYPKRVEEIIGKAAEIYRCEFCKTLYKPDPRQMPHSYTLRY